MVKTGDEYLKAAKGGKGLNESELRQLTSKIDNNLTGKRDKKRKEPPMSRRGQDQDQKRRRDSNQAPKKPTAQDEQAALLAEIKELGGDESDLALINGVASDDDDDNETYSKGSSKPADRKLKDDLKALSKELGLADYVPSEASEAEQEMDESHNAQSESAADDRDDDLNGLGEATSRESQDQIESKGKRHKAGLVCILIMRQPPLTANSSQDL